ncbi:CbiX/SirB N-terminal domain-containing protein [Botrimarina mediterranea]|uniref:Sirohydrochlorin ferrochelatase n=1 Tax=Botrimarina mediterranea TaxID=2528022 RepID=A0A518K3G4_9BACT|nr:CbiX/SirB N-terminal domain-containing protein [Botrimarina mediterranea]QDV72343.1 Sirohydrochlorin ferrochelatase [Botrimarina mediterranea]QDV76888.1 Sirohydrochlorin ferrochelatase [Planctomycetes bacterium K2D]
MLRDRLSDGLRLDPAKVGVVVVDHGSRRTESNELLHDVAALFERVSQMPIVEPAHMELAEPSIAAAFARCVERGAETVVVFPYFLSPGRHWSQDIPQLAAEAARNHPGVRYQVTSPLGLQELMAEVMSLRIAQCLQRSLGDGEACDLCRPTGGCVMQEGGEPSA